MAILILDNLGNVIFTDPSSPSGRVRVTGLASARTTGVYEAFGRRALTGSARVMVNFYAGTGQVGLTGTASVRTSVFEGFGRMAFTGTALVVKSVFEGFGRRALTGQAGVWWSEQLGDMVVSGMADAAITGRHLIPTGQLALTGGGSWSASYSYLPSGGIEFTGLADTLRTRFIVSTGRLRVRGTAPVLFIPSVDGTDGPSLTGQAGIVFIPAVDMRGDVGLTGRADVSFIKAVIADGRVRVRGEADIEFIPAVEGNVKAFLKGSASASFLKNVFADGRLRFRGSAFAEAAPDFDCEPTGGFAFASAPASPTASDYTIEPAGGVTFTGLSRVRGTVRVAATGSLGLSSGPGPDTAFGFTVIPVGGLSLSGTPGIAKSAHDYAAGGTLLFAGPAPTGQGFSQEASGGVVITGLVAPETFTGTSLTGGGFGLGGTASTTIRDIFTIDFNWRIRESNSFEKTFGWGVGERPFSFYRVSGKCKPATCPPVDPDCPPDSRFTYVVNIYARNLSEVCRKLRERNMVFPIAAIQKFSTPASRIDYTDDTDTTCNKLVDVTPPFTFLPCQDLLVDVNAKAEIGVAMKCVTIVAEYEASGRLGLITGSEYPFDTKFFDADGSVGLSGAATCVQKNFIWNMSGGFEFGGTVEKITVPVWTYDARGAVVGGVDGSVRVVKAIWDMQPTGGLGVTGSENGRPAMSWVPAGGFGTADSTAFGPDDYLPFIVDMAGGFGVTNATDAARGEYAHEPEGGFAFAGLTRFLTPHITITPQGGLRFRNGPGSVPQSSLNSDAGIVGLSGEAGVFYRPGFPATGRLGFGGQAGVIASVVEPSGRVSLGGSAIVNCSDLGVIAMPLAFDFSAVNATVLFAYDEAPAAVRPARRITTRCCTQSLPLRLRVEHPLARGEHFRHFLQRNNLLIDNPVEIYYNAVEKAWYNTVHFEGFAPDFPTIESWAITFGWSCGSAAAGTTLTDNADVFWKFSMTVTLRSVNNPTIPQRVSKLVVGFDPTRVCFNNKALSFPFIFNTSTQAMNPAPVQTLVYVDDIGLFRSPAFLKAPEIRFKVSELVADIPQVAVDIGPAIAGSQQVAADISGNILSSLPAG